MGSCCSVQPGDAAAVHAGGETAQRNAREGRYAVAADAAPLDEADGRADDNGNNVDQNAAGQQSPHHFLEGKEGNRSLLHAMGTPQQKPPPTPRVSVQDALQMHTKENTERMRLVGEEGKLRQEAMQTFAWYRDRIEQFSAQQRLIDDELERCHEVLENEGGVAYLQQDGTSEFARETLNEELLKLAMITEEYVVSPASFRHRVVFAEADAAGRILFDDNASPSPIKSPFQFAPPAAYGSPNNRSRASSAHSAAGADDLIDELVYDYECRAPSPAYIAPQKIQFDTDNVEEELDRASLHGSESSPANVLGEPRKASPSRRRTDLFRICPFDEGVSLHMIESLALPSATDERSPFRRSLIRELNGDNRRSEIVEGDPVVCLELTEVDNRDLIRRYHAFEWIEVRLLELQERALREKLAHGKYLRRQQQLHLLLGWERFEYHNRMVIEQEELSIRMPTWERTTRVIAQRKGYETLLKEQEVRRKAREAEEQQRAESEREAKKKVERLKWTVEQERLKKPNITAKERLFQQLQAAKAVSSPVHASKAAPTAGDALTAPTEDAVLGKQTPNSQNSAAMNIGRRRRLLQEKLSRLFEEENRWRMSVAVEAAKRWEAMMQICIQDVPQLLSVENHKDILTLRQQAELVEAKCELKRIEVRLEAAAAAERERLAISALEMQNALIGVIRVEEDKARKALLYNETLYRAMVYDEHGEELDIRMAHQRRRDDERRAKQAILDAEVHRRNCAALLQRVGRGYYRRFNLGLVVPNGEEVKMLVEDHRRLHKSTLMMENIVRGDLIHYFALQTRLAFPRDASRLMRDLDMYQWSVECVAAPEALERMLIEREYDAETITGLWEPFARERAVIALIPKAVSEHRIESARRVQRLWRGYAFKMKFKREYLDILLLQREKRKAIRSALRLVVDQESSKREELQEIITQEFDRGAIKAAAFEWSHRRWSAAVNIQRIFRGCFTRRHVIPPIQVVHYKRKLSQLQGRRQSDE